MATFKLLSADEFGKLCTKVMKAQRATDRDLQSLAINAIGHSIQHGDVQPANRLLDAMQRSLRKDSMVKFLEEGGHLAYMKADKKFAFYDAKRVWDEDTIEALLDGKMWFEAKKEAEIVSVWDVDKAFDKFMAQLDRAIKGGAEIKNIELRDYLLNAQATYHNLAHRTMRADPALVGDGE